MPIHEYACDTCGQHFEKLVRHDTVLACPACGGTALAKQLSVPAKPAGDTAAEPFAACPPTGCGACAPMGAPPACLAH